jgi:hypothetical protein
VLGLGLPLAKTKQMYLKEVFIHSSFRCNVKRGGGLQKRKRLNVLRLQEGRTGCVCDAQMPVIMTMPILITKIKAGQMSI